MNINQADSPPYFSTILGNLSVRAWRQQIAIFLLLVGSCAFTGATSGAQTIGGETALPPLPASAQWQSVVNLRPGNNETVTLNPPIFSWFYSPAIPPYAPYDNNIYRYVFQADYDGTFNNPVVNVTTYSDCYNFLAPFTNSPVHWRVAYMVNPGTQSQMATGFPTNGWTTNVWITNQFNIAANATNWDRSILANTNYLAAKQHPYIIFNGANGNSISNFISINDPSSLYYNILLAQQTTNFSWWTNPVPWTSSVWGGGNYAAGAVDISQVAFMWMLSGNPGWTNLLCTNYDNLVNYFNQNQLYMQDLPDQRLPISISLTYDWLYPILNSTERSNALYSLSTGAKIWMNASFMFNTNTFFEMEPKMGDSHGWIDVHQAASYEALACFNDSPTASTFLNLYMNYLIARVQPFGAGSVNQGRGYSYNCTFAAGTIDNTLMEGTVFPEANLAANPVFNELGDWWTRMQPPGYEQVHEQFGDVNLGVGAGLWWNAARDFAMLTRNGNMSMNGQQMAGFFGPQNPIYSYELAYPYFYPVPGPTVNNALGVAYPDEGWAFGSTYPANTTNCFYNGVGFAFMARPRGSEAGHSHFNDLDFEIWAYGANITDGAGGSYGGNKDSFAANTVQINGLGQCETEAQQMTPIVAQISAFTNAPDYVYVAGDATLAYPHQPFLTDPWAGYAPAGWLMSPVYSAEESGGPLSYVSAVHRELLFEHHKYFVIYDTIQTTNAPTNTFSWVYHVYQNTLTNLNGGSFQYTSPRQWFNPPDSRFELSTNSITTYVFQGVNGSKLSVTNLTGTNAYLNPFTGENLYGGAYMDLTQGTGNPLSADTVWVSNLTPTNTFHFMTVIYPVPPGGTAPTFASLDDGTVAVTNGGQVDVISFNPQTTNAVTLLVDSPAVWSNAPPTPAPLVLTNFVAGSPAPINLLGAPVASSVLAPPTDFRVVPPAAVNLAFGAVTNLDLSPVPGYYAWWDPDTLNGADYAPVTSWVDASANSFILGQCALGGFNLTPPVLRTAYKNGHNVLSYDGRANAMINSNYNLITGSQPMEVFVVCQSSSVLSAKQVSFGYGNWRGNSPNTVCAGMGPGGELIWAGASVQGGAPTTNWMVMTMLFNGSNSQLWTNGVSVATGNAGNGFMQGVALGVGVTTYNIPQSFWNGSIGDVIIYNNVLDTADQQAVENGLRAKYGF